MIREQKQNISEILSNIVEGMDSSEIINMIEIPPESSMGDYAFPCFKLAKIMHKAPNLIAAEIKEAISESQTLFQVKNVNAYVNFYINRTESEKSVIKSVLSKGKSYGSSVEGKGKRVIIDYSSPNIAKPFHIGHIRSTVIGNSLYKIFDFLGYDVIRINHLGDYGTQFGKMIVAYKKWGNREDVIKEPIKTLLSYYVKFHEEAELHPELEDEARETFKRLENGEKEEYELWKWFRDESLKEFQYVYDLLEIEFDSNAGESFYSDKLEGVVEQLKEKNLLQDSQGAKVVELEEYGLPPALITKSDGSTLYMTRDLAAAIYRNETYDFDKALYVVASQQNLHFKQLYKVLEKMGYEWSKGCVHVPFGMVSLTDGTMSTRKGKFVFLLDVLNNAIEKTREIIEEKKTDSDTYDLEQIAREVGIGAVVFQELSNNRIKDYTFSWDKVLNFDGETGPYVQYTHARAASVLRKAPKDVEIIFKDGFSPDMSKITTDLDYRLISLIGKFPDIILDAADKYEPSIITRHIIDIAQEFNKFYHDERILVEDADERQARLAIVEATRQTLENGLALLGINAPSRM